MKNFENINIETNNNAIKLTDNLTDIFNKYPYIMQAYTKKGLLCVGCKVSKFDTVEESFEHNNVKDRDEFLIYLNKVKNRKL